VSNNFQTSHTNFTTKLSCHAKIVHKALSRVHSTLRRLICHKGFEDQFEIGLVLDRLRPIK